MTIENPSDKMKSIVERALETAQRSGASQTDVLLADSDHRVGGQIELFGLLFVQFAQHHYHQ